MPLINQVIDYVKLNGSDSSTPASAEKQLHLIDHVVAQYHAMLKAIPLENRLTFARNWENELYQSVFTSSGINALHPQQQYAYAQLLSQLSTKTVAGTQDATNEALVSAGQMLRNSLLLKLSSYAVNIAHRRQDCRNPELRAQSQFLRSKIAQEYQSLLCAIPPEYHPHFAAQFLLIVQQAWQQSAMVDWQEFAAIRAVLTEISVPVDAVTATTSSVQTSVNSVASVDSLKGQK